MTNNKINNYNFFNGKKIYVDSSAAMNNGFKKFVKDVEATLVQSEKKIFVLKAVWLELVRLYNGPDQTKANSASNAISIISSHRNIFEIEDEVIFQDEMEKAFADRSFLSTIIMERAKAKILLITNDQNLSLDALSLNNQLACKGHKITTYFISKSGKLIPRNDIQKVKQPEPIVVEKEIVKYVKVPTEKEDNWALKILIPSTTLAAGIIIGKNYDRIIQALNLVA